MMNQVSPTINALVNLLEDDDRQVSTLAMERLLAMDQDADGLVAELQESQNPVLRGRIHQLGAILKLRRERAGFIQSVQEESLPLWQGILQINYQYNPRFESSEVETIIRGMVAKLPPRLNAVKLAAFMRNEGFTYAGEDVLGADLYMVEDVLIQRVGAPILLAVIARQLSLAQNLDCSIVLYKGKHCLVDDQLNLIETGEDWRVGRLQKENRVHACSDRDIWLTVLAQLFLAALLEGRLQAIHRVGTILSKLCGGSSQDLPFPLGS